MAIYRSLESPTKPESGFATQSIEAKEARRQAEIDETIREIKEAQRHAPRMMVEEILSARHERRR